MSSDQATLNVLGPYPVAFESLGRGTSKRIRKEHARSFWSDPATHAVADLHGCYVFALQVSGGFTPWYVGKASKTFAQEALTDHKLVYYNEVVYRGRKGLPVLFFVVPPAGHRRLSTKQLDQLETFLIQSAAWKNRELKNQKKVIIPDWGIRGVIRGGKGKAPEASKRFKAMMGL